MLLIVIALWLEFIDSDVLVAIVWLLSWQYSIAIFFENINNILQLNNKIELW